MIKRNWLFCFSISIINLFVINQIDSQGNAKLKLTLSPIGIQIGSPKIEEHGLGTYNINSKKKNNLQFGFILSNRLFNNFHWRVGLNLKKLNYEFNYLIYDPIDNNNIFLNENRFMKKTVFSPNIGIQFEKTNYFLSLGIEPDLELNYKTNVIIGQSLTYLFIDPVNQKSAQLVIEESDLYYNDLFLYLTPTFNIGYKISSKISIEAEAKVKPFGNFPIYRLEIDGRTSEMPSGYYSLNDTRIINRYFAIYLGVSYSFNL